MKNILAFKLLILFTVSFSSLGRTQVFEHEDLVLELNLGFPNLRPLSSSYNSFNHGGAYGSILDQKEGGFGQLVFKAEFFMSDRIGFIANLNYRYFYDYEVRQYDIYDGETGLWTSGQYEYELKTHLFRWAAGFNFHLARTDRLDTYLGVLGGGSILTSSLQSDDPDAKHSKEYVGPFHARVHYGLRYMFTEKLGFNTEFGLGGPLISAGITYKI